MDPSGRVKRDATFMDWRAAASARRCELILGTIVDKPVHDAGHAAAQGGLVIALRHELRGEDGTLHVENMKAALQKLHELGVAKWAVIHCPELGCGMDEAGNYCEFESLKLPKGYIKGTVGAGDAFCAGVLYAAETDMPLPEALKLGACSAAASLSEVSASDGVKAKDEVLKLYELYGKK